MCYFSFLLFVSKLRANSKVDIMTDAFGGSEANVRRQEKKLSIVQAVNIANTYKVWKLQASIITVQNVIYQYMVPFADTKMVRWVHLRVSLAFHLLVSIPNLLVSMSQQARRMVFVVRNVRRKKRSSLSRC